MAREVLDGIKGRLAAATPGPWGEFWQGHIHAETGNGTVGICQTFGPEDRKHPNAVFIAAAPADVARLTGALEAVLAECDEMDRRAAQGSNPHAVDRDAGFIRAAIENALNPKEGQ